MGKLLEVRNLTKKYYEGAIESRAVDSINLEVDDREFIIVMGASGSGKTSLLHLIAGIDTFDEGMIHYRNADLGHMSERAKAVFRRSNIGIVFQQHCLIPDLTVYENIMLPVMLDRRRRKGREKTSMKNTISKLCRQVGLEKHVRKYPSQLSGGQQQRAAILRSIINRPPLLLCDEPTGSLNSAHTDSIMRLLNILNKKGQTILLVTHDIKVAVRGKRIVYMKDGRIDGELKFSETHRDDISEKEVYQFREKELMNFLQEKGW
ncbi:MAG: ABC transporter ATP-binding protein [Lachnospiraceae bacterium]|nr:ABC transporter ATP-binding protein [Lachnospiraceae bacterium]